MSTTTLDKTAVRRWKRYPKYRASGVDWLAVKPAHWEILPLKRRASIRYGLGQPPEAMPDGSPLIRATNVKRGRISEEGMMYINPADVPISRDAVLRTGDIIVVRSGAYTGDSAIIPAEYAGAIAGYDMVVRTKDHSPYLSWHLLSPDQQPLVSVPLVEKRPSCSFVTANKIVEQLAELGMLRETTGWQRNRRYRYDPYLALFDALAVAERTPAANSSTTSPPTS